MNIIVNPRGTNASGKTTVVREYMNRIGVRDEIVDKNETTFAYVLNNGVQILGPYSETGCGGCDKLPDFDFIKTAVRALSERGHVIFEGLLWSTVTSSSVELARSLPIADSDEGDRGSGLMVISIPGSM